MSKSFRSVPFDPLLIIFQIIAIQFTFYASYSFFCVLFDFILSAPFSKDQVFNYKLIHLKSKVGFSSSVSYFLVYITTGIAFSFIVKKASKALDFVSSAFFIHFIVVACYTGFPTSVYWWILSAVYVIVGTIVGILLAMRYENRSTNVDEAFLMH